MNCRDFRADTGTVSRSHHIVHPLPLLWLSAPLVLEQGRERFALLALPQHPEVALLQELAVAFHHEQGHPAVRQILEGVCALDGAYHQVHRTCQPWERVPRAGEDEEPREEQEDEDGQSERDQGRGGGERGDA